jgi:nitrate reductase cytochrome c-type subunit
MRGALRLAALLLAVVPAIALGADAPRLTGPTPMPENVAAPPLPAEVTDDIRRGRNYPDQPPVIPHSIRGYEINLNVNRCLTCHSRPFTQATQAPQISTTHYQDRDGQILATVAPRRYNCTACHVPQTMANPLVENRFEDIDTVLQKERERRGGRN